MKMRTSSLIAVAALGLVAVATPREASAQYFGRNKVQYERFDFRVLKTPDFDIYYYPEEEEAARDAARMAQRWYQRLSTILDHRFEARQPIVLYANHPHFQQTTTLSGDISEGTGGVTEAYKQRVILPFAYSYEETDHVLGHELVHAFQYDISGLGRAGGGLEAAARRFQVPLWFVEGMAEYLSVGPVDPLTAIWLRNAALSGTIPSIRQLEEDPNIFPYRYGQALWAYIGGRWGDAAIGRILKLTGEGMPYRDAFQRTLGISLEDLSSDWETAIRRTYLPQLAERGEAREEGRGLITSGKEGGTLNVGPVLSPDGRRVAFLSEVKSGDVDLLLANAETGEIIRKLQKGTVFDSHYGSLRYIQSAGAWSPDGRQFAFSALRDGQDVIVFVDAERGERIREIVVPGVGEITSPTWSPDGRTIVFSGIHGGVSDLYATDLETGASRQLTNDRFTELQPVFSPDGGRIAFVTDRFGTDFQTLVYGDYQLAIMDFSTRAITPVPGMAGTKNMNPQWTGDGAGLFFISNRSGIPNVYRVALSGGEVARITNIFSGVSGITDMSPALSVARNAEVLVFTAFEDKGYNIYRLNRPESLAGTPADEAELELAEKAAGLPPYPRPEEPAFNRVSTYLADARTGLPSAAEAAAFPTEPYRAKLGLDYIGQPEIGVSVGSGVFGGTGLVGGISGIFSDVLGGHTVGAVIQAQGAWDEVGAQVQYLNSRRRWNWGVGLSRIPTVYGYYAEGYVGSDYVQQIVRQRIFDSSLSGYLSYPISSVQRIDFGAGVRRLSVDQKIQEYRYDGLTGLALSADETKIGGPAYNLAESQVAWVFDSAVFGYTAPIAGNRARLGVEPTGGQLQFVTTTADFRKYLYAKPFTLALRGMHYGRYGRNAEGTFSDLYLGNNSLLRGYNAAANSCFNTGQSCSIYNQLIGSRIAVANAELRVPLLRPGAGGGGLPLPPIDAQVFYDAGVAWTSDTSPSFQRGELSDPAKRGLLTSAGVGIRSNLFGFMVLEVDYLRAFEASQDWRWVFSIQPGF
ncbi:MAG: peptidase S9 [Gemmatimonadota bacterium]|jgi:Tol biopolymer transport system component|nr:peptidase S9 [Gemmatimonadota bacterium]